MLPHSFARSSMLMHILDPALRSLALGAAAAIVLFVFRVKNPSARLAIWKGVLYAALAMPLLALTVPAIPFPVPQSIASLFTRSTPAVSLSSQTPTTPAVAANSLATLDIETAPATREPLYSFKAVPSNNAIRRAEMSKQPVLPVAEANTAAPPTQSAQATAPLHAAQSAFPWAELAGVIFAVVALFLLARIALGAIFGHRLVRSAQTIADCDAIRVLMRQARSAGVVSPPHLAESGAISVPVTLGILRPVILLPTYWRKWDEPTLRAVVAHEMSHIARRDALTQRLALLHRAIFWFSPLAWWLNLALADAAEEASDEAALLAGADRAFYATTLLNFFAALSQNSRRVYWQGVSMAAPGQADRRVDRILNWKGAVSMRIRKSLAVALAVVGVPAILLAAAARPSTQAAAPVAPPAPVAPAFPANPPAAPLPAPNPQPMAAPLPPPAIAQAPPDPAVPQEPVVAPAPPDAPFVVVTPNISIDDGPMQLQIKQFNKDIQKQMNAAQRKSLRDIHKAMALNLDIKAMPQLSPEDQAKLQALEQQLANLSAKVTENSPEMQQLQQQIAELKSHLDMSISKMIATGPFLYQVSPTARINIGDSGDRFVIVSDDSPIIMSGNSQDVEHATALRSKINGDFIWFQRDEKSYVIKDPALVNEAKGYFKNEQDLGAKQQDLGKQMRALGDQMRDQGQKMRDVHVTIPDLSADMEKLEAQMKQLSASGGTQQQLGDLQRQLGELMRKLGQNQNQAGEQQRQIGEQQRQLGDQMRTLGDQMRELGHQQRDASRQARDQMKQLLDNAVTKGTAQPE
ncbi:MAG TPA: M56 family metallopeptidase [Candidatus Acidoferrales bacterium]|nr:M56 family metallopeptidase [Candidatus Acidoferrales bacterium]